MISRDTQPPTHETLCQIPLKGRLADDLVAAEQVSEMEKRHLVINRELRSRFLSRGVPYYDLGTDYEYPFFEHFSPTQAALEAMASHVKSASHYPSSYGLIELRSHFVGFLQNRYGIYLDPNHNVMVTSGASQVFDALSRGLTGKAVLVPELSLPTVRTIARGNGAEVIRIRCDGSGFPILSEIDRQVRLAGSVRFLYLNSPCNPNGQVASIAYLRELVNLCNFHGVLLLHDADSWFTTYTDERAANVLEVPGALECSITVFSVSKEFGLPGLRVGLVAGNRDAVRAIRVHNSLFCVMLPEPNQRAVLAALQTFTAEETSAVITSRLRRLLEQAVDGWSSLGWPSRAIQPPRGGFKFLVNVPPGIRAEGGHTAVTLIDYLMASKAGVKLSTSQSFNEADDRYLRMILMQTEDVMAEVFGRLSEIGVRYDMVLPRGLAAEYDAFLTSIGWPEGFME